MAVTEVSVGEDARSERRIVVGRQSIRTEHGAVAGYELLFRTLGDPGAAHALTGDALTSEVVFGAVNIGLGALAGGKNVWVNADRDILTERSPLLLPAEDRKSVV